MNIYFAATTPGLEKYTMQELETLGLQGKLEKGGITFKGDLAALYRANLQLRTANRILARLGSFFYAESFPELQKRASRLPWDLFLTPRQPIVLHVTCHESKLYHSDAVKDTITTGLNEHMGQSSPTLRESKNTLEIGAQLIVARLFENKCIISIDSSGVILHKRGYRQAVTKAPLRETMAAAMIMASGWDKAAPLLDPFCGSGTIPIEAAMMAMRISAGYGRQFAFMNWPNFDEKLWQSIKKQSQTSPSIIPPTILASDRDAGAVKIAQENAERAGVEKYIEFKRQAVSSILPPALPGWVVTNPPYGKRISEGKDLRNLYAQLGNVLRLQCPGWQVAVLSNDPILLGQMRINLDSTIGFRNGGIQVRLGRGMVG